MKIAFIAGHFVPAVELGKDQVTTFLTAVVVAACENIPSGGFMTIQTKSLFCAHVLMSIVR
jgi:hypothetical protein